MLYIKKVTDCNSEQLSTILSVKSGSHDINDFTLNDLICHLSIKYIMWYVCI